MGAEPGVGVPVVPTEGEHMLSLRDFLQVIWKRLWIILLVTVVLTGAAAGFTFAQPPLYESSIKVLVREESRDSEAPGMDAGNLARLTQTMAQTVNSRQVAEAAVQELDSPVTPGEILGTLNAQPVGETQVIEVRYQDSSPQRAQEVINAVGDVVPEQLSQMNPVAKPMTATVLEWAAGPGAPTGPNLKYTVGAALVIGLVLGVGLAFLLEYLDGSWRSPEEAEQVSGVPTFGVIPQFEALTSKEKGEP